MTNSLFVYGTLVLDDVIGILIDRVPTHEAVTARGWRVARLPERPYPGLVPGDGEASGRLYTDLTADEWTTLDAFEDPVYSLSNIEVLPGPREALAYVWPEAPLIDTWSLEDLRSTDLASYLQRCEAWRNRYEQNR